MVFLSVDVVELDCVPGDQRSAIYIIHNDDRFIIVDMDTSLYNVTKYRCIAKIHWSGSD